ncbi:type IV secretion system protein VirB4 [Enhydrobacter aerosaccus]|uniref:Type IV secretion system protein VirB4 n=1 Tax=Enhydrobacter aerosaccus TaxID=225324 RepID=A0A1T4TIV8_9HYPH|nr:transporter [Enhydrobacter aerosaccus]SKA40390.1 type IV secretion system protein VirB4 [Enhydrobacter aerosaccus]
MVDLSNTPMGRLLKRLPALKQGRGLGKPVNGSAVNGKALNGKRPDFAHEVRRGSLIERTELRPEAFIPYVRHADEQTVVLESGALLRMWVVEGAAFETIEQQVLDNYHNALNEVWRSLDDDRVGIWHHVVRSLERPPAVRGVGTPFGRALEARYVARLSKAGLRRNELLLSLVVLPKRLAKLGLAAAFKKVPKALSVDPADLERMEELAARVSAGLRIYGPTALRAYEEGGVVYSGVGEALHLVLNGERARVPVPMGDLGRSLLTVRPIFGPEAIELRGIAERRYAGMLSVGEYPSETWPGMLAGLLSAPFDFVLTQSFVRLSKTAARTLMGRKQNQFRTSGDKALSQTEALSQAMSELENNRFAIGQHHLSLLVYGDTPELMRQAMADGRRALSDGGFLPKREDLSLIPTFFAQLPGNMAFRVRKAEGITSRNFAALAPLYSYPRGRRQGLHWGAPVAELKTASGGRYAFSFHVRDVGHTLIVGMSGSGKSVLLNFGMAGLLRLGTKIVMFDKDRSSELFVGMMGGQYSSVRVGLSSGAAPLKAMAEYTPRYAAFLRGLIARLVMGPSGELSPVEADEIERGIASIALMPREQRTMAALAGQLGRELRRRLARWIAGGELGWVLDAEEDQIAAGFDDDAIPMVGIDITELLRSDEAREPLLMYLFEKLDATVGTRRMAWVIEEFHAALHDASIRRKVDDALRTWRKRNGMAILVTQSPSDAAHSEIAASLLQQTATKISLPNPAASWEDYERFKFTRREYDVISHLSPLSRRFLVKQVDPDDSGKIVSGIVCELDLHGMKEELAILSPSAEAGDFSLWDAVKHLPIDSRWDAFKRRRRT